MNMHINDAKNFVLSSAKLPPSKIERVNTDYSHGLPSVEKNSEAVFEALEDENVKVIGLWGMGGIGKTTLMYQINNELERRLNFRLVIIVTVSNNLNISDIQDKIESRLPKLKLDDSTKYQLDAARAYKLSARLVEQGNILIIFDDVWEPLDFSKIGIPENKLCKIVLTTRKQGVCARMGAKEIKLEVLDASESWNLFKSNNVGRNDIVDGEIKDTAENLCRECAGLPLAISVVAKSLKNETDIHAWHQALKFLENANPKGVHNLEKKVYNSIRLSYDRLETKEMKDCFLICSLFPEDDRIRLFDLICYGIGEGKPWAMSNKGIESLRAFLYSFKQLKSSGLLQDFNKSEDLAIMHDIVRDVAINIAKEKGFLIKTGLGCTDWPQFDEEEYHKGKKWISLMENSFKDLTYQPQNVQGVEFLSLNGNRELKNIHSDFFEEMQNLLLLDLRETSISELTWGIQKLKKLRVFMYAHCGECGSRYPYDVKISIPIKEFITLKNLSVLCLQKSYIQELNDEFGTLVHLRFIDFSETSIDIIRPNVFSRLQKLEVLFMRDSFRHWKASHEEGGDRVAFEELATLVHLYALKIDIEDEHILSKEYRSVECFPSVEHFSFRTIFDSSYGFSFSDTSHSFALGQNIKNIAKWVKNLLEKRSILRMAVHCRHSVDALIEPDTVKDIHNLEFLVLYEGSRYKNVIKYSSNTESDERPILPNLKEMNISLNCHLDTIIATPSLLPHGSFQGLVKIDINFCNNMRFAFTWSMAQCLVQLRRLNIDECRELKHIIGNDGYNNFDCLTIGQELFPKLEIIDLFDLPKLESVWQQEESQENMKVQWPSMKSLEVFPKLEIIDLYDLPKLESLWQQEESQENICGSTSMKSLEVRECKNLKPFVFGKQSAPALERIIGKKEWFEDFIWEDEETKNKFKSLFEEWPA